MVRSWIWSHSVGFFLLRLAVVVRERKGGPWEGWSFSRQKTKKRLRWQQNTESAESSVHFLCRLQRTIKAVNSARLQRGVGEYPSHQVMQISPGTVGLFRWHYAGVQFVRCSCGWRLSNIARVSAACKRRPAYEGDGSDWLRRFPPFRRPSHFQHKRICLTLSAHNLHQHLRITWCFLHETASGSRGL